jgi:hypothetical protein
MGDANININYINRNNTLDYLKILNGTGYRQLIDMDTRIGGDNLSCIDHIFSDQH